MYLPRRKECGDAEIVGEIPERDKAFRVAATREDEVSSKEQRKSRTVGKAAAAEGSSDTRLVTKRGSRGSLLLLSQI